MGPFLISFKKQGLIILFLLGSFILTFTSFYRGKLIFADPKHRRILLVSHELSPTGAVRSLLDIRFGLKKKGYQVDFVILDQGYISTNMLVKYSNVTTLVSPDKVYESLLSYGVIVANTIASDSWIERQGLAYGQQFFDRLIWYIRELPIGSVSRHLFSLNSNKIRKNLLRRAKTVIFVSHASRNTYLGELGAINRKRLKVLYNPVDMKYFENILCGNSNEKLSDRLAMRSKLRILEDDMVVRHMMMMECIMT